MWKRCFLSLYMAQKRHSSLVLPKYTYIKVLLDVFLDSHTEYDSDVTDCFSR